MRRLFILIIVVILASCSKDEGMCFDCHYYGTVNGVSYDDHRTECNDDTSKIGRRTDLSGNLIPSVCTPK